ncbi:MAG: fibronectin type III domain-containing protein [Treponema sp.]|nr:fibronectin type III domain-containing protein [Treponema sp.]
MGSLQDSNAPVNAEPQVQDSDGGKKTKRRIITGVIIAILLVIIALIVKCGLGGPQADPMFGKRTPVDISNLSIVFIDGEATLFWDDSTDEYLDHIEISWDPNGSTLVLVDKSVQKQTVQGILPDVYYTFTVKAVDEFGNKSVNTIGGRGLLFKRPPGADGGQGYGPVTGISGTPKAGQVTLSWNNLADTEYDHLEITYDPSHEVLIRVPKGIESKMIRELTNGLEHTFYVAAVDADGNRKPVKDLGIFIPEFSTLSESVYGKPSQGQVMLKWTEPADPDVVQYDVYYGPGGDTPIRVARGNDSQTITGLDDNQEYEFTVYATSRSGYKRPLMGVALYTPEAPTFEDTNVGAVKGKPVMGQITLDWDDPKNLNLDHIEIIYQPGGENPPVTVGKGIETKTFTGLDDAEEYTFIVYGVDAQGNKRAMSGVRLSTPEKAVVSGTPVSGQVTINWSDPEKEDLDHIELTYTPGGETSPVIVPKGVETHTFTELSDDTEYNFSISAVTKSGVKSAVSNAQLVVPELPVLIGTPVNGSLSVKWTDPDDIMVDHVEVVYAPDGETPRRIARGEEKQTFSGLKNGTEYAFNVYAVDRNGNRYPVKDAAFYTPETVAEPPPAAPPPVDRAYSSGPGSLVWRQTGDTTFGESTVLSLAYGQAANGAARWVAGGTDGKMAYSNDNGLRWSTIENAFGSFSIITIAYGNGRWIAGGGSGKMMYSTNAINWTSVQETHFTVDHNINTIAFAGDKWLAGGSNGIIIASFDNGVTWTPVANSTFGASTVNTITHHGGRWIAGGANGKIAYSNDGGTTWTAVGNSTFGNSDVNVIIYDKDRWLAGGYGTRIAWSVDGIVWRAMPRPFYILGLGYNGNRWIAGGQAGRMAWSMDGGDSWTTDEGGSTIFGESWVQAVAFGKGATTGRWLSGGQNGKIIYADER